MAAPTTVPEVTPAGNRHIANGSTLNFAYTFAIESAGDIVVMMGDTVQSYPSNYWLTGVGSTSGGEVQFTFYPPDGMAITILRAQTIQQLVNLLANSSYAPTTLLSIHNRHTAVDQMLEERINRAPKLLPESTYGDISIEDPVANQFLRWNSALDGIDSVAVGSLVDGAITTTLNAGRVTFASSSTNIDTDGALLWDDTNKRLGVGITPVYTLDVAKTTTADNSAGDGLEWGIRSEMTWNTGTYAGLNEKAAIYGKISVIGNSANMDGVGIVGQGFLGNVGGTQSKAWGMLAAAISTAGCDGGLIGLEIDLNNWGAVASSIQDTIDQSNSKIGIWLATGADGVDRRRATAAIACANDTPGVASWYYGIYLRSILAEYMHFSAPPEVSGAKGIVMENSSNWAEAMRIPNNVPIFSRNAANDGNVHLVSAGLTNGVALGDATTNTLIQGTDIIWGRALVALGGGAGATLGTIGGSGPSSAGQNTWLRVLDSTGAASWVPVWK